ncbi:MAG: hypothetical protein ACO3L1_00120 [Flavobacteriaceae bacterium]
MENNFHLMDKDVAPYLDIFVPLLLKECEETLLPELVSVFGEDGLLKFLNIFSGTTFRVPDRSLIFKLVRDAKIFVALNKKNSSLSELSVEFGLTETGLSKCYDRVESTLKAVGVNVSK